MRFVRQYIQLNKTQFEPSIQIYSGSNSESSAQTLLNLALWKLIFHAELIFGGLIAYCRSKLQADLGKNFQRLRSGNFHLFSVNLLYIAILSAYKYEDLSF